MKLLLTGAFDWTRPQLDALAALGLELIFVEREDGALPPAALQAEAVVCNWLFARHPLADFPRVRYIQLLSAGLDRVPLDEIRARGIVLHSARGVYSIPMAEFAVSGVLQLYKRAAFFAENQRRAVWQKNRALDELFGKTVLIVGCGSVGCETAKRFSAFTDSVLGVDLFPAENKAFFRRIYPVSALEALLPDADVVVLTLPLTDETRNLMNRSRFSRMKRGALLVNIARGGIVDEAALLDALHDNLGGAVLDVFAQEPLPPDSPLWTADRVLLSPHNSFVSGANAARLWALVLQNLQTYLTKKDESR